MKIFKKSDAEKKLNESKINDNKIIKKLTENEIKEKNELKKLYIDEGMTINKISNIYNCSSGIIKRKLRKYDIPIRPRGSFLVDENGEFLKSKMSYKEYRKYIIEEKRRKGELPENCMWLRDKLEDLYAYDKQNLSPMQIGKLHDPQVHASTIMNWINIYGIEKKTGFELYGGKNSGHWKGGISNGPYCEEFTSEVKEYERKRWYRKCVLCNKTENYNGQKLSVHHVDYNKNQGCDSTEWKLITLCRSCNTRVNINRNYYEYLFINLIMIRKTLEEFDWKIDYKSIGMIDEIKYKKIDKLKYKINTDYFGYKCDWRSLGI